jgi:FkbM family methyltransferase
MSIKHKLRKLLWKTGYDISRFIPTSHPVARRRQLFESYNIDIALDVGANTGQFAQQLRGDIGYSKRIASFEPLNSAFNLLKINAKDDPQWETFNFALGDTEEKKLINIAENAYSSSLLNMLPSHVEADPESRNIGREEIEIRTLDSVFNEICSRGENIYLKIDTQGYENRVIKGAENSLTYINTIQLEMSLVPLYEGELLFDEMCRLIIGRGYSLVSIEAGFSDKISGQLLQVDGIFHRF